MMSGGGKYWPWTGSGAQIAASAIPKANRTALAFTDAFLVRDRFAARRIFGRPSPQSKTHLEPP
jgi:hypothetical protein